jgi:5-formyltetrahydrofolate cyclo-ligase
MGENECSFLFSYVKMGKTLSEERLIHPMNIREQKIELRKKVEYERSQLTSEERTKKQTMIQERLVKLTQDLFPDPEKDTGALADASSDEPNPVDGQSFTLLTYMPFRSELDITPFMEWCWQEGNRVLLPRVVKETRSLVLHEVHSYEDVDCGLWGIREPKAHLPIVSNIASISMILVPGLAFDREFGRLGYGGGFYDRFMQLYTSRELERPFAVAAAFDLQVVPEVPVSWHDFRVDGLITETQSLLRSSLRR